MRALVALAALVLASGPAHAESAALGLVRTACAAHSADSAAIANDLTALGWRQLTDQDRLQRDPDNFAGGFVMHWSSSQAWAPVSDEPLLLLLGEGPLGEARAKFCLVSGMAPFRRQVSEVRRWLGFGRFETWGPGGDMFAYIRDGDGGFSNGALPEADREGAVREGRFGFVQVIGDQSRSAINFSVVVPQSRAQ